MEANAMDMREAYLDLLKRSLANYLYLGEDSTLAEFRCARHYDLEVASWTIDRVALPATLLTRAQLARAISSRRGAGVAA